MRSRSSIAMRHYRKVAGLSQRQLGRLVGCSGPYISQIETGAKIPTYALDNQIARALGLSGAEDFYGRPQAEKEARVRARHNRPLRAKRARVSSSAPRSASTDD